MLFLHGADSRDGLKRQAEGDACLESNIFEQILSATRNTTESDTPVTNALFCDGFIGVEVNKRAAQQGRIWCRSSDD